LFILLIEHRSGERRLWSQWNGNSPSQRRNEWRRGSNWVFE